MIGRRSSGRRTAGRHGGDMRATGDRATRAGGVGTWRMLVLSVTCAVLTLLGSVTDALPLSDPPSDPLTPLTPLSPLTAPRHDGQRRLVARCPTAAEGRTGRPTVAVFSDGRQGAVWAEGTLEEVAQALAGRGIQVIEVNLNTCSHLKHVRGVAGGSLLVYHNRTYHYQGLRSSDALVSFVLKVNTDVVTVINSKAHKKAFDKVQGPKLVALLKPGSQGLEEFQQAAAALHPYVTCSILPDNKILDDGEAEVRTLKDLKDKAPGTIAYYAPYEEIPQLLPEGTAVEILRFFSEGQLSFLRRLYPYDMYATMDLYKSSGRLVLAFLLPRTPEGLTLYKVLRRLANKEAISDLKVNVLYVNMEDFPLNICSLEEEFGVDLDKPVMGLVNITTGRASWFTKPDLHLLDKDEQTQEVYKWLTRVADGQIRVDGVEPMVETDTKEEEPETKEEKPEVKEEDGDFKPDKDEDKDEKDDDEGDDEKEGVHTAGKEEREEESTTPTEGHDKEDKDEDEDEEKEKESDKDKEDEGEEEDEDKPVSHTGSHDKHSAYMRQFNDGDKLFTNLFNTVFGPILDVLGVKSSPEDKKHAASAAHTKPKVKPIKKEAPKVVPAEPQVTSTHTKDKSIHKKYGGGAKPFTALFRFFLVPLGLMSDGSSPDAKPEVTPPKSAPKTEPEDGDKKSETPAKVHIKSNDKYMSPESDKLMTNIIKGVHHIVTLPLQMLSSSETEEVQTKEPEKEGTKDAPQELPKRHVKASSFRGTESDKLLTNLLKTIFHPVIRVVNTIRGEEGATDSPKEEPELPKKVDAKHSEKPQKSQATKPQKAKDVTKPRTKDVTKPKAKDVTKPKAEKPKKPVKMEEAKESKKMPAYGGEDDKLIAGLFKSAMNLVSGGTEKKEEPEPTKEPSKPKVKKEVKQKKVHKKPKAKHADKVVPLKIHKKDKKDEPVEDKKEAPKQRVVVPGENGKDKYMSPDDKIFVNIVKMVKSVVAPGENEEPEEKAPSKQEKPEKPEKSEKPKAKKPTPETKEIKKEKSGKKLKAPKGLVPKDEPLPPIKKIEFGDESDKLITSLVKNVISTVKSVVGVPQNGEDKPEAETDKKESKKEPKEPKEEPKPYKTDIKEDKKKAEKPKKKQEEKQKVEAKAAEPDTDDVEKKAPEDELIKVEPKTAKAKMPEYGGESDKLLTGVFKAMYGLGQNAFSHLTAHSVQASPVGEPAKDAEEPEDEEEAALETPPDTKTKPKPVEEKVQKTQKKQKAKPKPRRVYKPVPVPSFKPEDEKAKSDYYNKFKANDEDKLITSVVKFIVNTVKNIATGNFKLGGKQAKEEVDDGDSLTPKVVLSEQDLEVKPQVDDSLPKAEALNTIFKEESYGTEDEQQPEVVLTENDKEEELLSEEEESRDNSAKDAVSEEDKEENDEGEMLEEVFKATEESSEDLIKATSESEEESEDKEEVSDIDDDKSEMEKPEEKEETKESEEDEVGDDEDNEIKSQTDFLSEAFKEEAPEEVVDVGESLTDDVAEVDSADELNDKVNEDDNANKDDDDKDDDDDDDKDDETEDTLSTEEFISMAFTDEESKKQELFTSDHDDDDELDDKDLSYLPFSEDPRKEFLLKKEENEAQEESEHLYEHGKAYDRHRHGRQRL